MASKIGATILKKSTGLTGLAVSENPHHVLSVMYGKTLRALNKMPEDAVYRKSTESIVKKRAQLVETTPDILELEKKIGAGQIEEVIIQAENEMLLSRKMLAWKAWEPLETEAPPNQWKWPI